MKDVPAFVSTVRKATEHASNTGEIVTLGITPSRPETGYGYLKIARGGPPKGPVKLEAFVEKRGRVHGDLAAHLPSGVLERLPRGDRSEAFRRPGAKGAAAGGQQEAGNLLGPAPFKALENRVVFAVNRQDADALASRSFHDGFARQHEDFLAGHGQILAGAERGQRRGEPGGADNGDQHHVGVSLLHHLGETLGALKKPGALGKMQTGFFRRLGI